MESLTARLAAGRSPVARVRRAGAAMLALGGATAMVGVWTTAATPAAQRGQGAVAAVLVLAGMVLAALRGAALRVVEAFCIGAIVLIGVLVGVSEPLGMAATFFLWPMVLLAYASTTRVVLSAGLVMLVALGGGLLVNTDLSLRLDTFVGAVSSVGVMTWLVATMTRGQRTLSAALAVAAQTDPLTGLANRRAFVPRLEAMLAEAVAADAQLAVVMLDLDHFKRVNDTLGHQVGDRVLEDVAAALREVSRSGDLVARLGGEEFAVALPGADADVALRYAARVAERLSQISEPTVTTSAGICVCGDGALTTDDLLGRADAALYAAKAAGRDRAAVWGDGVQVAPPFRADGAAGV